MVGFSAARKLSNLSKMRRTPATESEYTMTPSLPSLTPEQKTILSALETTLALPEVPPTIMNNTNALIPHLINNPQFAGLLLGHIKDALNLSVPNIAANTLVSIVIGMVAQRAIDDARELEKLVGKD